MPTIRWLFSSPRHDETFRVEGNPEDLPNFKGWVTARRRVSAKKVKAKSGKFIYKEPTLLYDGILFYGRLLTATKVEGAPCSTNCRRAMHEFCSCSCHGKNHGIDNRDMANAIQEEDVIYVG